MITEISFDQCKLIEKLAFPPELRILYTIQTWDQLASIYRIPRKDLCVLSDGKTWFYLGVRYEKKFSEVWQFGKLPNTPTINRVELYTKVSHLGIDKIFCHMNPISYKSFNRMKDKILGFKITLLEDDETDGGSHLIKFSLQRED